MTDAAERTGFTASASPVETSHDDDPREEQKTLGQRVVRQVYRRLRAVDALTVPLALFDATFRARGFLRQSGWFESYRHRMPLAFGKPVPFYTYGAISFLAPRIDRTMSVFEYGSGYSTLWWAERAKSVTACEHHEGWLERMKTMVPANVSLLHQPLTTNGAYSKQATAFQSDIIVVDGRDRVNCAKNCLSGLTERGVVIWDNSDRDRYQEGYDFLTAQGFRRLDFAGFGPIDFWPWCTTVFYRNDNCLGI
jgi:hypothetical protein